VSNKRQESRREIEEALRQQEDGQLDAVSVYEGLTEADETELKFFFPDDSGKVDQKSGSAMAEISQEGSYYDWPDWGEQSLEHACLEGVHQHLDEHDDTPFWDDMEEAFEDMAARNNAACRTTG